MMQPTRGVAVGGGGVPARGMILVIARVTSLALPWVLCTGRLTLRLLHLSHFARISKSRQLDQAHQTLSSAILITNIPRLHLLPTLHQDAWVRSKYIDNVQNIEDRKTITKVRLDHNKLNSCTIQTNKAKETILQPLPHKFRKRRAVHPWVQPVPGKRSKLESTSTETKEHPNFKNLPNLTKLQIILNVEGKNARARTPFWLTICKTNLQEKMRHCILIRSWRHPECHYGSVKLRISISIITSRADACFM